MAQPQPLPNPTVMRFPGIAPSGYNDKAVAIGLWEEQGDGVTIPANQLVAHKVFVAGTMRNASGTQITVARYNVAGGQADAVAFWPPPAHADYIPQSMNAAKAMVVPAVPFGTPAEEGRVFVTGTVDGIDGSSDIIVLAYDFNLKPKWMKTFNDVDPGHDFATFDEVMAITTDQTPDMVTPGHDTCYNFVAVLGRVQDYGAPKKAVTLVYCKRTGNEVMPPKYEAGMPGPIDIAMAQPQDI